MAAPASTAREASALSGARFTPAEAELTGAYGGGLAKETLTARPSWARRKRAAFENSVWAPVAFKLMGLALGMLALAGVGVASILSGLNGVQVPLAAVMGNDIHAGWLASKPTASTAGRAGAPASTSLASMPDTHTFQTNTAPPSTANAAPAGSAGSTNANAASAGMTEDGKVILNAASIEDLRHLPGVGPKRAEAILALRLRLGHFKHINDLLRVKGIGVKGLKKILPHIVLDGPKPVA